jgi:translation initiation factor IF-2
MSDTREKDSKTAKSPRKKTLSLKRTVDAGQVKQNFSHGRSKMVVVETRRKRILTPKGETTAKTEVDVPAAPEKPAKPEADVEKTTAAESTHSGNLSKREIDARNQALEQARIRSVREAEEQRVRELEEARVREELERQEALKKKEEEQQKKKEALEGKDKKPTRKTQEIEPEAVPVEPAAARKEFASKKIKTDKYDERTPTPEVAGKRKKVEVQQPVRRKQEDRRKGKLTISNALSDGGRRSHSLASMRRRQQKQKKQNTGPSEPRAKVSREVILPEAITIQELSNRMAERAVDIIKWLMQQGQMHKINDIIDADTAELIADEFGHTTKRISEDDVEIGFIGDEDSEDDLRPRAPVVTIMGHVDHGKTSLLDALRNANVVSGEAGGITQHIGAYQVETSEGKPITFIDTPGHAAFTSMRARGAEITDIVILVVAANDGVMPQTIEAISHAKAANVPIIVAVNKIDLDAADPTRVRTELLQHGIVVESMSGEVQEVEVSATERIGLDQLLEAIALEAEVLELKANPDRSAEGGVIEAQLERGRGAVATVLVKRGTLRIGQIVAAGTSWGKVRALIDHHGENVKEAGPSTPVEVLGMGSAPSAGDTFAVVESEAKARELTEHRERKLVNSQSVLTGKPKSLVDLFDKAKQAEGLQTFPIIVKGDVQGSVEAITASLEKLGNDEVAANVVHSAVGGINESDVTLAEAAGAVILGFNVRANQQAKKSAEEKGIEVRYYSVIYDIIDDIKSAMSGMLSPELREEFIGNARILEIFSVSKVGKVAGCLVTEGKVERGAKVRLIRDNVVIHEGKLGTLKRFKDDVDEVPGGQECGMAFESYQDMRPDDVIECFRVEEIQRSL